MIGVLLLVSEAPSHRRRTSKAHGRAQRVRYIPVIAPRGVCWTRDGRVLVDNRPAFSVLLLRDEPALWKSISRVFRTVWESLWMICGPAREYKESAEIPGRLS